MADRSTPNLPSSNLNKTAEFYSSLGFTVGFKDDGWLIITKGDLMLEFFPRKTKPKKSFASCCLRVDDLDDLHAAFEKTGLKSDCRHIPRLTQPLNQSWGQRDFALVDIDGNLIRCIQN